MKSGKAGLDCRGEEHEVSVVWSITSGKKQIMVDSKIIHTSMSRSSVFEYTWNMKGNHIMKLSASATSGKDARQYDFYVDGQSFYNMPKVYELGLNGSLTAHSRVPGVLSRDAGNRGGYVEGEPLSLRQEEKDLQLAIKASIEESKMYLNKNGPAPPVSSGNAAPAQNNVPTSAPEDDLLNFGETAVVPATGPSSNQWSNAVGSPPPNQQYNTAAYVTTPSVAPVQYSQPPPAQTYSAPMPSTMTPQQSYPSQNVAPSYNDPFAPQPAAAPTYNDIHNQILQSYGSNAGQVNNTSTQQPPVNSETFSSSGNEAEKPNSNDVINETALPVKTVENPNNVDNVMGKLVNLMDINSPAEMAPTKLTLSLANNNSKGFTGPTPTLGQMKALRSQSDSTVTTAALSSSSGSGAMVVSGQQNGNFGYVNVTQTNYSNNGYGYPNTNQQPYGYGAQPNAQQQYGQQQYGYGSPTGASYQ